ncbi:fibronectin type III domain-containing protein [Flavivirga algicola]|uniref:Fibronectin type III domain-containing protein n=1 Tax=Flavivirga algicola TaxID=2729136 RepID=A0ABX1RQX4_9FLAO|nr:fibronectin type III domain-containing protein [Flavivirga algicola]NMH85952.1 fibronectin type III domain-containing protein [Flavivirga algicola]
MRKLFIALCYLFVGCYLSLAQQFPIQVIPQINPPAPVNFYNYADVATINSPINLQLALNDITIIDRRIRLKVYFEGHGINFQSNDLVIGATPLFISGGVPLRLDNTQLAPYFEFQNIQGINPNVYRNTIPEGSYQFCFEVFDFNTGNRLSSKTCQTTFIFSNEPPLLNLPLNKNNITPGAVENIVFQWTPRHINVSNVEYELSIVEVWDGYVDPQTAFQSLPPIFQTTTRATTFIYGPAQPLLLGNKKYAWRVKAKALQGAEEIGLFRNDGYSEIFWFTRTEPCGLPNMVAAKPQGTSKINVYWEENPALYSEYIIRYREANKPGAEWFTMRTNSSWATIWHLKPGTTYEYQVAAKCKFEESDFTEIQEITTETEEDETANYNCGIVPDKIAITNRDPHPGLTTGDRITAGDFIVTLTNITSQSNGIISGKGFVQIPYLKYARFAVVYDNVLVNSENQLAQGEIVTVHDGKFGEGEEIVVDVDIDPKETIYGDQGDIKAVEVDFEIEEVRTNENGGIEVIGTNGEVGNLPGGKDTVIRDRNGDVYTVSEDGSVSQGEMAPGGPVIADNGGSGGSSVDELEDIGVRVDFIRSGIYSYDNVPEVESNKLIAEYPTIKSGNDTYTIPFKAISKLQGDDIIKAVAHITNSDYKTNDIVFKTKEGIKIPADWNGEAATLNIKQTFDYAIQEIFATIPSKSDNTKHKVVGTFNLVHLSSALSNIELVLVPINNAKITNGIADKINDIYNKSGVNFSIKVAQAIQLPDKAWNADGLLDVGDSGHLSYYTNEEKQIIDAYKSKNNVSRDTYYLFISDLPVSNADVNGFMPLKSQFGFVFGSSNQARIAAHELGHGVFGLEHPFEAYKTPEGATDFLMDYGTGTRLTHMDWKTMYAPGFKLYWFQDDKEGAYTDTEFTDKIFQIIRCAYLNTNKNGVISFDTSVFGKTGTFHSTWEGHKIWIKIDQGDFEGMSTYEPIEIGENDTENRPWRYSLLYRNVEIYTPRHSTGADPTALQALRKYLFPQDKTQLRKDIEDVLAEILNKNEFEDKDFEKIKSVANCGVQYLTAKQRFQIISKIVKSVNITEYYEDLILDLFETSPLEDATNYYDAFLGYFLEEDAEVLKELFADIDDAGVGVLWKGREHNYTRFINALANVTSKLDKDAKKWQIVNHIINNDYGDMEDVEKNGITMILGAMDEHAEIADKVPAISELFINMLEDDHCEALKDYKIVFEIATFRNSNRELFASFTQSESTVLLNNEKIWGVRGKARFSWVRPVGFKIKELDGGKLEIKESELGNYYAWSGFLNEDQNSHIKELLKTNPPRYFQIFLDQLSKHFKSALGTNNKFWDNVTSIDCNNRKTIVEHINANENSKSLKNVNKDLRLELLVKMFECNWFGVSNTDAFYKNAEDVLTKLVSSFDPSDNSILITIENKIGLDKIYDKLSGEQLSEFFVWAGNQIVSSEHFKESAPLEILKEDGAFISKDEILKLEADLFSFQNFSAKISDKTKITTGLGTLDYRQMVLVYVEGSFTFLDKKYKKGDVLYMPLIQAFAMSNSNSNIALSKGAWFAFDVASFAVGIGSVGVLIKVGNTVRKVVVSSDLIGSSVGMLANALNDDAISEDMRFKINMLTLVACLPQIATISKRFDNIITELDDQIDQARGLNATSREVLEEHLEKIAEKIGTDALKQVDVITSDSNKKLSDVIEYKYEDPNGEFLDISLQEIHESIQKLIQESELPEFIKLELAEVGDYKGLKSLIGGHSEILFNMVSSSNKELVDYAMFLIKGRKEEVFDHKTYKYLVAEAQKVFKLTPVKVTPRTNDGGFRGAFFDGELNGNPVVFKYDLHHKENSINEMEKILIDLKPYGAPDYYGRFRVQLEDGTWREVIGMERITGYNIKKIKERLSKGEDLDIDNIGFTEVTSMHLKAIDDIENKLLRDGNRLIEDINLGDFILTNNPDRPIVMIDMLLESGTSLHQGLITSGSKKTIREVIEELIEKTVRTSNTTPNFSKKLEGLRSKLNELKPNCK